MKRNLNACIELAHVVWIGFAGLIFTPETKTCIKTNPLLTYLLLFILMIGFLHVIKCTFYVIAMMLCCLLTIFGLDPRIDEGTRQLREPLYEQG